VISRAEPVRLGYPIFHIPARITRRARQLRVAFQTDWPRTHTFLAAFAGCERCRCPPDHPPLLDNQPTTRRSPTATSGCAHAPRYLPTPTHRLLPNPSNTYNSSPR
jgi:hypothetical protein